ncbi:MAG: hypothetical protein GC193_09765 [Cryomorphaceae bacterium]|nr:hypothetical protein [Cryomorphaceae bacterium]
MVVPGSIPIMIFSCATRNKIPLHFKCSTLQLLKSIFRFSLRFVLPLVLVWLIFSRLNGDWNWNDAEIKRIHYLVLAVLLWPLNWFIEALKWWLLTAHSLRSLKQCLIDVLVGQYFGLVTPNRLGEGPGRMNSSAPGSRSRDLFAFGNSSIAQLLTTLIAGSIALVLVASFVYPSELFWWQVALPLRWPVWTATLIMLLFYIEPGWSHILRESVNQNGWLGKKLVGLQRYNRRENGRTLFLSMARYGVFSSQFLCVLLAFGFDGDTTEMLFRIALVYLGSTIVPSFALAELGVRESMAVMLLPAAGIDPAVAFIATLLVWIINILLPSMAGMVLFFRSKRLS